MSMCARLVRTHYKTEQPRADQLVYYISHPPGASVFSLSLPMRYPESSTQEPKDQYLKRETIGSSSIFDPLRAGGSLFGLVQRRATRPAL